VVCSYTSTLLSNTRESISETDNNLDESWNTTRNEEPDTKEHFLCVSIYTRLQDKQNLSMVTEIRSVVALVVDEKRIMRKGHEETFVAMEMFYVRARCSMTVDIC